MHYLVCEPSLSTKKLSKFLLFTVVGYTQIIVQVSGCTNEKLVYYVPSLDRLVFGPKSSLPQGL